MGAYSCLVIIAVVSLPLHLLVSAAPSELDNAQATLPAPPTPKPLCKETFCPRLYMPVCGIVNGEQVTAPSRCVLNNKIRCSLSLQRSLGKKVPKVGFLHNGPCSPKADKSIVVRMRRDMSLESNEESPEHDLDQEEYDVDQEEYDASKEDDNSNEEILDSGESGESGEFIALQHHNANELQDLENQADLDDKEAEADNAEAEMDDAEEQEDEEMEMRDGEMRQ